MNIVAGLSCIDDYIRLAEAGADEVFCGFVPYEWTKLYGNLFPLNRREALYFNTQIKSLSEMKILRKMVDVYKVPVTITFNNLYYLPEQYELIGNIIKELIDNGFSTFIIADIGLILYLRENNIKCSIQLSGECAETNSLSIDFFNEMDISRYIFNRKNSIEDMQSCIKSNKALNTQYEAFILNERCHYTGAFCNSLHCDEMIHLCEMPYQVGKVDEFSDHFPEIDNNFELYYEKGQQAKKAAKSALKDCKSKLGSTGCGLCALKRLQIAGITHLKVVGRGECVKNIENDIRNLKRAIRMVDETDNLRAYSRNVKSEFFEGKCSQNCYYLNV